MYVIGGYSVEKNAKIFVAGGTGLVGSAIISKLLKRGYSNIVSNYYSRFPGSYHLLPTTHSSLLATHFAQPAFFKLNLTDQQEVEDFFKEQKPEYVFLAAAKVGGIWANNVYRADFIYQNLQIQNNVIYNAYKYGVKKLMFLGSTCIYPKECPQPIKEEYLLTSPLEYTNEPYAVAKIAGIKMCESFNLQYGTNFLSVMPTNLYGYNDNFDLEKSHVLPALIRKMHLGKLLENEDWEGIKKDLDKNPIEGINGSASRDKILKILEKYGIKVGGRGKGVSVEIWGSGKPMREFLWSEDMADACVYLMENVDFIDIVRQQYPEINKENLKFKYTELDIRNTHINIGTGKDLSIRELAYLIKEIIGFQGELVFNTSKPDGTFRKVTDVSKLNSLGWKYSVEVKEGVEKLYTWYCSN